MDKKRYLILLICYIALVTGLALIIIAISLGEWLNDLKDIFINIGAGLLPGSIISLVIEYAINKELKRQIDFAIKKRMRQEISKLKNFDQCGLHDVLPRFVADKAMKETISAAKTEIRILNCWIPNFLEIKSSLEEAVKNDCKVKILLLSEDSKVLPYRIKQLGISETTGKERIRTTNWDIQILIRQLGYKGKLVEVRFFDDILPFSMYQFDSVCYIGSYFEGLQSIETHFFKLLKNEKDKLLLNYNKHFTHLWENSIDGSLNNIP